MSFDGRVIVAASIATAQSQAIGIWSSSDGLAWTLDVPEALAGTRLRGIVAGPRGLVLAGVRSEAGPVAPGAATASRSSVWTSTDGRTWTDVAGGGEFDDGLITDIATDGIQVLAIGEDASTSADPVACPVSRIWRSADGGSWELAAPPEPCARLTSIAGRDGAFVVFGEVPDAAGTVPGATKPVAWLVRDDAPWHPLVDVLSPGVRYSVIAGAPGFIAVVTARTDANATPAPVLFSADGATWTAVDAGVFGIEDTRSSPLMPLGFANGFSIASVRPLDDGTMATSLFRSEDGTAWTLIPPSDALNLAPPVVGVALHDGKVIALGGRTHLVAWVSPPSPAGPDAASVASLEVTEEQLPGSGTPRAVAFDGEAALAVGTEIDVTRSTSVGRAWRWTAGEGWTAIDATGLDGAEVAALAHGPAGWVAVGSLRRPLPSGQGVEVVAHAWRSEDGRRWTAVPPTASVGLRFDRLTTIVGGGPGYVAAGSILVDDSCGTSLGSTSVMLTSADGVAWSVVDDPDLACAEIADLAVHDGALVAVGAETRIVSTVGPSPSPCGMEVCLVGTARSESQPLAWSSADGLEWVRAPAIDVEWSRTGFRAIAAGVGGFVATWGRDSLLVSSDGKAWSPSYIPIGQVAHSVETVAATADGYLAVGLFRSQSTYRLPLYFSTDGQAWRQVDPDDWSAEPNTFVADLTGADEAGFLLVGAAGQPATSLAWQLETP